MKRKKILTISSVVTLVILLIVVSFGISSYISDSKGKTDDITIQIGNQRNMLISGKELNAVIPDEATSVEFLILPQTYSIADATVPEYAIDVTVDKDRSIMAWLEDTTFYVVSTNGKPIYAQADIADNYEMFKDKINLTYINMTEVVMSEIAWQMFEGANNLKIVDVPRPVSKFNQEVFNFNVNMEYINFDPENEHYASVDGVVYSKDMKTIVAYPIGHPRTTYTILEGTITIENHCFSENRFLQNVYLPAGLTNINYGAFNNAQNLTTMSIPASVTTIGTTDVGGAIVNCVKLNTITFTSGSKLTTIVDGSFYNCGAYTIDIPTSVKYIGEQSFCGSANLTALSIPSSNNYYKTTDGVLFTKNGQKLICYPSGKTITTYTVPEGVTSFGTCAFSNFHKLTSITLPKSLTLLKTHSFYSSTSLLEIVYTVSTEQWTSVVKEANWFADLPDDFHLRLDRTYTDAELKALHTLIPGSEFNALIPDNVKRIEFVRSPMTIPANAFDVTVAQEGFVMAWVDGTTMYVSTLLGGTIYANTDSNYMFKNKAKLEYINMADVSLTTLPENMFDYCTNLKTVVLPSNLQTYNAYTFYNCTALQQINISVDNKYYCSSNGVLFSEDMKTLLTYPAGKTEEYYNVPSGVVSISNSAFRNCAYLKNVSLPASIRTIQTYAFYNSGLTYIYIPKNVSTINSAFGLAPLTAIEVDPANSYFCSQNGVLYNKAMTALIQYPIAHTRDKYTVPYGVTTINAYAFQGCTNLTELSLPRAITSFGTMSFANCSNLKTIIFNGSEKKWNRISFGSKWDEGMPDDYQVIFNPIYTDEELRSFHVLLPGTSFRSRISSSVKAIEFVSNKTIPANAYDVTVEQEGYVMAWVEGTTMYVCSTDGGMIYANSDCDYMFQNKTALEYVNTENLTMSIPFYSFDGCTGLKTIDISKTVTMTEGVFATCISLTDVNIATDHADFRDVDGVVFTKNLKTLTLYPAGRTATTYTVPDGTETIANFAFFNAQYLTNLNISDDVKYIYNQVFVGTRISSFNISKNVIYIGSNTFSSYANSIYVDDESDYYMDQDGILFTKNEKTLLWYPRVKPGTSYEIPDTVTTIGSYAFKNVSYLTELHIPLSVTTIRSYAFYNSSKFTDIYFEGTEGEWALINKQEDWDKGLSPDCVFHYSKYTQAEAIELHTLITGSEFNALIPSTATSIIFTTDEMTVPASAVDVTAVKSGLVKAWLSGTTYYVCSIDGYDIIANSNSDSIFANKSKLTTINLAELSLPVMNSSMFNNCTGVSSITLPNNLRDIGYSTLSFSTKLRYISISSLNKYYVTINNVFFTKDMKTLIQYPVASTSTSYSIPNGVETIYTAAFSKALYLRSITMPNTLKTIEWKAFDGCSSLTSVIIPASVETIGDFAFRRCTNLTAVSFANDSKLSTLSNMAFVYCSKLQNINVGEGSLNYSSINGILFNKDMSTLLVYPAGKTNTSYVVQNGTKTIDTYAFHQCSYLTTIIVPYSVSKINTYAFNQSKISTIKYCGTVEQWGAIEKAANWDKDMVSGYTIIYMDDLITSHTLKTGSEFNALIPDEATSVVFVTEPMIVPTNAIDVTSNNSGFIKGWLDETTFYVCSLTGGPIYANSNITGMFDNKSNLTSIDMAKLNSTNITTNIFTGCSNLSVVTLPDNLSALSSIFSNLNNLTEIDISTENSSFITVDGILFNKNMTTLYRYPSAKAGTSFTVPNTVTNIYSHAFQGCLNLSEVLFEEDGQLKSIGSYAFSDCRSLTSLSLPSTLTTIGMYAFKDIGLSSITIPKNVQSIGTYAFSNSYGILKEIIVEPENTKYISVDGVLFNNTMTALNAYPSGKTNTEYTIPDSITNITTGAFDYCQNLQSVILPEGLKSIAMSAFSNCTALTSITIPSTITAINYSVFKNCTNLTQIYLPKGITNIYSAFAYCSSLKSIYFEGTTEEWNNITFVDGWDEGMPENYIVFTSDNMEELHTLLPGSEFNALIPSTATSIIFTTSEMTIPDNAIDLTASKSELIKGWLDGTTFYIASVDGYGIYANESYDGMFRGKSRLVHIDMSELNISTITNSMFTGCTGLTSIVLPTTLQTYNTRALANNPKLSSISISSENELFTVVDNVLYSKDMTILYFYPNGKTETSFTIPTGVTTIYGYAFCNNGTLKTIEVPVSVTTLNNYAFAYCGALTNIVFAENIDLKSISTGAFDNCRNLTSIELPNSVTAIQSNAFRNTSIVTIKIPANVRTVVDRAFDGMSKLIAFEVDTANRYFVVEDGILFNNTKTRLIQYPIAKTGTKYTVPASVTTISAGAFNGCKNLKTVKMFEGVKTIGNYAFQDCSNLELIEIPASVTNINMWSLSYCTGLKLIYFKGNDTQWNAVTKGTNWNYGSSGIVCTTDNVVELHTLITGSELNALIPITATSVVFTTGMENIPDDAIDVTYYQVGLVKAWLDGTTFYISSIDDYEIVANAEYTNMFSTKPNLTHIDMSALNLSTINSDVFTGCTGLTSIVLPNKLQTYNYNSFSVSSKLASISISPNNEYFTVVDNVLYSKDMTILYYYPNGKTETSFTIPTGVTTIFNYVFFNNEVLTTIEVPETVRTLNQYAFGNCKALTNIVFAENCRITAIPAYAFQNCVSLENITLPNSILTIDNYAFRNTLISTITIPASVRSINTYAFSGITMLNFIEVDAGNNYYSSVNGVLFNKTQTTLQTYPVGKTDETYTVPTGVATIYNYAFANNANLKEINIPLSVANISAYAFQDCTGLKTIVYDGARTEWNSITFGSGWNSGMSGYTIVYKQTYTQAELVTMHTLTTGSAFNALVPSTATSVIFTNSEMTIPADAVDMTASNSGFVKGWLDGTTFYIASVDGYGIYANTNHNGMFNNKTNLTSIDMAALNITQINAAIFTGCRNLNIITLPNTLTSYNPSTFASLNGLTEINIDSTNGYFTTVDGMLYNKNMTILYRYPSAKAGTSFTVPNTVTNIYAYAFQACSNLTSVVFEDGTALRTIGNYAFAGCPNLTEFTIPSSTQAIGFMAFSNVGLTNIFVPASVTSIGDRAFGNSAKLTEIIVDSANGYYSSLDGVLYNKDITVLYTYPVGKTNTSYTIPEGVITISAYAFGTCTNLTEVVIPSSTTSIGNYAFSSCRNLKTINYCGTEAQWNTITKGTGWNQNIHANCEIVFNYGISEEELKALHTLVSGSEFNALIPDTATSVEFIVMPMTYSISNSIIPADAIDVTADQTGRVMAWMEGTTFYVVAVDGYAIYAEDAASMFNNKTNLTYINLEGLELTTIGDRMFYGCSGLTYITLPENITSIGEYAFYNCTNLISIEIPNEVMSIDNYAFGYCSNLATVVFEEESKLATIDDYAFVNCSSLTTITIPNSVESIDSQAFRNCTNLNSITLSTSLKTISYQAFYNCTNLISINIPASVISIGGAAFGNCTMLTAINVNPANTAYISIDGILFSNNMKTLLAYPAGKTDSEYTIPDSVINISSYAFAYSNVTSITMSNNVSRLNTFAFSNCTKLTDITISNKLTTIDNSVFSGCISLINVNFAENSQLKTIGNYAFSDCSSLISIELPSSIETIGNRAFYRCTSLKTIDIPNNVNEIGGYAFYGCTSLISTVLPKNITLINDYAFFNCSSLTEIVISEGVTSIGVQAFYGCRSLTTITLPESLTSINERAFGSCRNLKTINFNGTEEQWNAITFGASWNIGVPSSCKINFKIVYTEEDLHTLLPGFEFNALIPNEATGVEFITMPQTYGMTDNIVPTDAIDVTALQSGCVMAWMEDTTFYVVALDGGMIYANSNSDGMFSYKSNLEYLNFDNITAQLIANMFTGCTNLKVVDISASTTNGNYGILKECANLTAFNVSNDNPYFTSIDGIVFTKDMKEIVLYPAGRTATTYTIPDGTEVIASFAFYGCKNLTTINVPSTVQYINNDAFAYCSGLTTINFEEGSQLKEIGSQAFYCVNITTITIPSSVRQIGTNVFGRALNLIDISVEPTSEHYTFVDGVLFTKDMKTLITYPAGKTDTEYVIPNGVENIQQYGFLYSQLTKVTIPNTITKLVSFTFSQSKNLQIVDYIGTEKQWNKIEIGYSWNAGTHTDFQIIFSPIYDEELIEAHTLITGSEFNALIPSNATRIEFISNATIPSNAKDASKLKNGNIKAWSDGTTFYICSVDGSMIYANPDSSYMFYNKTNLTYINTENLDMSTIINGAYLFYYVTSLTNTMEDFNISNMTNYSHAFEECAWLKSIEIPAIVTEIGPWAFKHCYNLETVTFEKGSQLKVIDTLAFTQCFKLTSFEFPDSLERIGSDAFSSSKLTAIRIPANVNLIGQNAFPGNPISAFEIDPANEYYVVVDGVLFTKDMKTLVAYPMNRTDTNYIIPQGVEEIYAYAFYYSNINAVTLPASIKTINQTAFYGTNAKTMYYEGNNTQWNAITKGSSWNGNSSFSLVYNYKYDN